MLNINSTVEFRNVGEGMRISDKFVLYGKLVKTASEGELLDVVENKQEPKALRAYAYMAYAYQCDSKKRKEKPLNINFKISTLNGCIGYTDVTFPSFKTYIRKRNAYNPDPTYFVRDAEEERVIKEENKIRKEQGIEPRKEK